MTSLEKAVSQKDPNGIALEHAILSFKQQIGRESGIDPATSEITRETARRLNQSLNDPQDPLGNELAKMVMLSVQRVIHDDAPDIARELNESLERIKKLQQPPQARNEPPLLAALSTKDREAITSAKESWPDYSSSGKTIPPGKGGGMGRG